MKALGRNAVLFILLFASARASAQCSTPMSVTYDTTVSGSGNDLYTFTFPKFDPTVGTLVDVNVDAIVTRIYGFELENSGPSTVTNHRVRFISNDYISSSVLAIYGTLENEFTRQYQGYVLAANNGVPNAGPDYLNFPPAVVMNQVEYNFTATNTADFMGAGQAEFNYETVSGNLNSGSIAVDYRNGYVEDDITFRIAYNYCPAIVLASDITSFTAGRLTDGNIDIKWITKNEKTNRKYELQKSTDGRVFRGVTEFAAQTGSTETGSYRHSYKVQPDENNRILYFRLKLIDGGGSEKYSGIRAVKLTSANREQPILYPNPAKGTTTLHFNNKNRGNWEVEILTISGQVVKRYFFNNALLAKLNTANDLHRGLYMVRSINKTTQEQFIQRLLVQ